MTTNERRPPVSTDDIVRLTQPLGDGRSTVGLDGIVERVARARHVFIGEASHGTSEYYSWRARLTQRLISDHGFSFVAVEGDWPDCRAVDAWVRGRGDQHLDAADVLRRFDRWPTWMWANVEVAEFITWLRDHNRDRRSGPAVGFHGLDVYSLWDSLQGIVDYLRRHDVHRHDSAALERTLSAMQCFEPYGQDPQRYAAATRLVPDGCEEEVTELLADLRRLAARSVDGTDDDFDALQNAEVLAGAEHYYRAMVRADTNSWNIRDHHMADTFDRLVEHHAAETDGRGARGIVWAHNTHVGDARATDMAHAGMTNIGQLARERHGRDDVALVGFGGFEGSVIAGRRWGAPWEEMTVPPSKPGSHEALVHRATTQPVFVLTSDDAASRWLTTAIPHRAIGVVYQPGRDSVGNWVPTVLGSRYDVFIAFGTTTALHPLDVTATSAVNRKPVHGGHEPMTDASPSDHEKWDHAKDHHGKRDHEKDHHEKDDHENSDSSSTGRNGSTNHAAHTPASPQTPDPQTPDPHTPANPQTPDPQTPEPQTPDPHTPGNPQTHGPHTSGNPHTHDGPTPADPLTHDPQTPERHTPDDPQNHGRHTPDDPQTPERHTPDDPQNHGRHTPDDPQNHGRHTPANPQTPERHTPDDPQNHGRHTPANPQTPGSRHTPADAQTHDGDRLAAALNRRSLPDQVELLNAAPVPAAVDAVRALAVEHQCELLTRLGSERRSTIFAALPPDERARLLGTTGAPQEWLDSLEPDEREVTSRLLRYPPESVGRMMTPHFIELPSEVSCDRALELVRTCGPQVDTVYSLAVTDDAGFAGMIELRDLLGAAPDASVASLLSDRGRVLDPMQDQEDAARLLLATNSLAIPVLASDASVLGLVTVDDAMEILALEESEDISRTSGAEPLGQPYLAASLVRLARSRAVWLVVAAAAAALTVRVLEFFEAELQEVVALALFIPLLLGTGGNIGAQAATTVVRAMAVDDVGFSDLPRVVWKEARVGVMLGGLLAVLAALPVWFVYEARLAAVISLTLVTICAIATMGGSVLPLVIGRLGYDPAVVSAPFITTLVDASGLLVYFTYAGVIYQL